MMKFVVVGVNWYTEVDLTGYEFDSPQTEAATRAVEALYGKRSDLTITRGKFFKMTKKQKEQDELHAALFDLLSDDLTGDCGVGMLICILQLDAPEGKNEWYISSKEVLENVGVPKLVARFSEKYPDGKKEAA